jgi:CBS domain-containing protein
VGEITKQASVGGLASAIGRLPQTVAQLVGEDASARDIGRVVTAVGDAVERRILQLAEAEMGPPPVPYCWVVLGSQARFEQGLSSDQDNAMIISDAVRPEHADYFRELAQRVVTGLAECGYPLCKGGVMATTDSWRQPLAVWRRTFSTWMGSPHADALVNASIFFDMRPLHGEAGLFEALREDILAAAPSSQRLLAHLTKAAVEHQPPLGFFRGFVLEKEGEHAATLDLKRGGVSALVELARVYALESGLPDVNTRARLEAAAGVGRLSKRRVDDLVDAFEFVSYVRLRHQGRQVRAGIPPDNFVSPGELTSDERRHLRDVFQVVRRAQSVLAQSRPLQYVS